MKIKMLTKLCPLFCFFYGVLITGVEARHIKKKPSAAKLKYAQEAMEGKAPRPGSQPGDPDFPACGAGVDFLAQISCGVCDIKQELCGLTSVIDTDLSCCDAILSQLAVCCSVIDEIACAVGEINAITEASFDGGPLLITESGYYALCSDIDLDPSSIQVMASDVTIDLGGFLLAGVNITVQSPSSNVLIKNGTMSSSLNFITIDSGTSNITVEDLIFEDMLYNGVNPNYMILVPTGPVTGVTVRNITGYNGAPANIAISGFGANIVNNVLLENIRLVGFSSLIPTPGPAFDGAIEIDFCSNLVMRNISIENNTPGTHGVYINNTTWIELRDINVASSQALSNTPNGLYLQNSNTAHCDHVTVTGHGFNNGIFIDSTNNTDFIFNDCAVSFTTAGGIVANQSCTLNSSIVSNAGGAGFSIVGGLVQDCIAEYNAGQFGFSVTTGSGSPEFLRCQAYSNGSGFGVENANKVHFIECTANMNSVYGFFFSLSTENSCIQCVANNNTTAGFILFTGVTETSMTGCVANNNGSAGFHLRPGAGVTTIDLSSSTANNNGSFGVYLEGVSASMNFEGDCLNPFSGGLLGSFSIIDPNIRVTNCTGSYNGTGLPDTGQFIMSGTLSDTAVINICAPIAYFFDMIPPIGITNAPDGAIYALGLPTAGTFKTSLSATAEFLMGAVNGNIISTPNGNGNTP